MGKITHNDIHCLTDLLPCKRTDQSLRQRGHDYTLPRIIINTRGQIENRPLQNTRSAGRK